MTFVGEILYAEYRKSCCYSSCAVMTFVIQNPVVIAVGREPVGEKNEVLFVAEGGIKTDNKV